MHWTCNLAGQQNSINYAENVTPTAIIRQHGNGATQTSALLAAADFADLFRALDPATCRGMYQSRK